MITDFCVEIIIYIGIQYNSNFTIWLFLVFLRLFTLNALRCRSYNQEIIYCTRINLYRRIYLYYIFITLLRVSKRKQRAYIIICVEFQRKFGLSVTCNTLVEFSQRLLTKNFNTIESTYSISRNRSLQK